MLGGIDEVVEGPCNIASREGPFPIRPTALAEYLRGQASTERVADEWRQACQDVHADPNILEGVDAAEATDPCLAGLCRHKLGAIRLGHMQHLLRYLRLSLSYVQQHCCANMDNSAVLQFRCGDKREHVLVGHSMALSNAARASLCLSLHVLCVCHCMFSLCLSLHVLTICKSLRN